MLDPEGLITARQYFASSHSQRLTINPASWPAPESHSAPYMELPQEWEPAGNSNVTQVQLHGSQADVSQPLLDSTPSFENPLQLHRAPRLETSVQPQGRQSPSGRKRALRRRTRKRFDRLRTPVASLYKRRIAIGRLQAPSLAVWSLFSNGRVIFSHVLRLALSSLIPVSKDQKWLNREDHTSLLMVIRG